MPLPQETMDNLKRLNKSSGVPESRQAVSAACFAAKIQLDDFAKEFGLDSSQCKERNIDFDYPDPSDQSNRKRCKQVEDSVPEARNHTDRGGAPLWHYRGAGQACM